MRITYPTTRESAGKGRHASRSVPPAERRRKRGDDRACAHGPRSAIRERKGLWLRGSQRRLGMPTQDGAPVLSENGKDCGTDLVEALRLLAKPRSAVRERKGLWESAPAGDQAVIWPRSAIRERRGLWGVGERNPPDSRPARSAIRERRELWALEGTVPAVLSENGEDCGITRGQEPAGAIRERKGLWSSTHHNDPRAHGSARPSVCSHRIPAACRQHSRTGSWPKARASLNLGRTVGLGAVACHGPPGAAWIPITGGPSNDPV